MPENEAKPRVPVIERSILDLDSMVEEAIELSVIGNQEEAVQLFKRVLAGLEERFKGGIGNIPLDVLVRRFNVLVNLSRAYAERESMEKALERLAEARELATSPLADFPEYYILSCTEAGLLHLKSGNISASKEAITNATKAPKGDNVEYCQALIAHGTGRLFIHFEKFDKALQALKSGVMSLKEPEDREQVWLKAKLFKYMGDCWKGADKQESAGKAYANALKTLFEAAADAELRGRTVNAVFLLSLARRLLKEIEVTEELLIDKVDVHIKLAGLLDIRGKWTLSESMYEEAMKTINKNEIVDSDRSIKCWTGVGSLYGKLKKYGRANEILQQALRSAESSGDNLGLAACRYHMALIKSKQGDDEDSVKQFETALETAKNLADGLGKDRMLARIYNQLGFIESKKDRYTAAMEYFKLSIEKMRPYPRDLALGEAYRLIGDIYSKRQQSMQGERALKMALEIFERNGAAVQVAGVYKSIGANFLSMGDLDKATYFLDESIELLEKLKIESDLPVLYSSKAKVCIMREDYAEAEELFNKDFKLSKESQNKHSLAFSYYHLGMVRRLLERVHSAEDYLKRSLELFEEVGNDTLIGYVLMELALCVAERKDVKQATDLCSRVQQIFDKNRNTPELAKLYTTRGVILRDASRRHMSERCFEDAIRIYEKLEVVNIEFAEVYYEYAMFWRMTNEKRKATEYLRRAIEIAEKLGLVKKLNRYLAVLNEFNPEEGAKLRLSRVMDKSAVEIIAGKKQSQDNLVVDRKNLTLLFTDIRGFTTISETLPMNELNSFLNDFYRIVTTVIHRYNGQVNKFIGDAIMAIFNMDGKLADHSKWAVRAGLAMVREMEETNSIRQRRGQVPIGIGIGVNTGDVLLGAFGTGLRQDYTAIGDNVNIAARLQAQAAAGELIISQSVYDQVGDSLVAEDLGEKPLKGKGQPLRLWKVFAIKEE